MEKLSELTEAIVRTRESKSDTFTSYRKKLNSISQVLDFILNRKNKPLWNEIISESRSSEKWLEIKKTAKQLNEELLKFIGPDGDFTIAASRASRTYVNIGSIGIMREGKSEFIAQTTQLDKWILPRKNGEHACTTASINVINGSSSDGKTEIARVYYYTVPEIVTLFADYLEEFGLDRNLIDNGIISRADLKNWCKSNETKMEKSITSSKSKLKQKFLEYISQIDKYVNRLVELDDNLTIKHNSVLYEDYLISDIVKGEDKGRKYYSSVSYYETPDSKEEVFTSFATSKAEVYTNFKVDGAEVNNIQFLDTPGIGEKKVGVDRILSDAVSMNLDIIIAIRALNGTAKEDQEQSFINILRGKVEGKKTAKDWIYYLLNFYEDRGQDYANAVTCIKNIEYHLTTGEDSPSISLDKDHFRVINLLKGYQLNFDGSTDSNNPIGKYLRMILENLIPKIDKIDADFFNKAETTYGVILKKYNELLSSARSLHLCDYDDYGRIQSLIDTLQMALAKENAKNPKIYTTIQHNIDDFCTLKDGVLVAKIFGAEDLDFNDSDSFYNKNKIAVCRGYDEGSYNSNFDFQTYSNLKRALTEAIREDIYDRMDQTEADRLLAATKEAIAKVFIEVGKMGFVSQSPQEWFHEVLDLLTKEGCYPNLQSIIAAFANLEIQTKSIIEPRVDAVISKCIHHDDFGEPEDYDFQKYENAAMTIVHSLFAIESYAKGLINDGFISDDIEQLQISFSQIYFSLTQFAANPNQHKSGPIRDELYHFYENNSEKVFEGDKSLQKRGLVTEWRNNIK